MSEYPPPRQPSSVYNSLDYTTFGSGGSSNSLNFPLAQGTETMGFGVVWGDGSYQNSAATDICNNSFVSYPTAQGQVSFPAGIVINGQSQTTAYTGYPTSFTPTAPNSLTLDSHGKITQIDNVDTNLSYVLNRGNDAGTLGMTNLGGMTQFGAASNSLNYTEINTLFGASATPGLIVRDTNSQKQFNLLPNVTAGAYNPATEAGNIQILGFKGGSQNTETLELTTWSSTNSAIKVNPTSVEIGAGGTGVTGTSNILCDGTTVNISPSVTYPDTTVQDSAFTGAGSLAGTYPLVNMTVDANGKITALSDESATYETVANAAATYETIANAALLAPLASPALTGAPTAPTQTSTDNTTKIATTAFVQSHVATGYAPIDSPAFTGNPTAPTTSVSNNSTTLATTNFTQSLTNAGRGNPQPGYAIAAGYFYSSTNQPSELLTITFDLSNPDMNATNLQLCNVTFRITCRAEWDLVGNPQYYNAYSNGEYIMTVFPGRFPNSDWTAGGTSLVRWVKNSGGTASMTGSPTSSALYTQTVWSNGSTLSNNCYLKPNGTNYDSMQFCFTPPSGYDGVFSVQVEVIGSNVYFSDGKGQMSVSFNNMEPTTGGGTSGNYYPKLYG